MRIAMLLAVLASCKASEPVKCDGREGARYAWMDAPARDDGATPKKLGFKAIGGCGEKLVERQFNCSEATIRGASGDSPYLRRALELGFTTYVCEVASLDDSGDRTEFPLASIVTR